MKDARGSIGIWAGAGIRRFRPQPGDASPPPPVESCEGPDRAAGAPRGIPRCVYILYPLTLFSATPPGILPTPKGARRKAQGAFRAVRQSELEGTHVDPRAPLGVGRSPGEIVKKSDFGRRPEEDPGVSVPTCEEARFAMVLAEEPASGPRRMIEPDTRRGGFPR